MNSKTETETIADILAEMRGAWGAATPTAEDLAIYAGRIEAAAGRERNAHINDIHDALYAATRLPGNAAALRSALEDTQDLLKHFTRNGGMLADAFALHMRDNDAALSAPPRNCDVGTAEEQAERFHRYCRAHRTFVTECSASCPFTSAPDINHCQSGWAQLPFEAAKEGSAE